MEYDEQDAVNFIISKTGLNIDEDDILNIIDIIWDYYEENELLDIDVNTSDEEDVDVKNIIAHAVKLLKKDKHSMLTDDEIAKIVLAELKYEKTLEIF